jgi:hypothetical protein
LARLGAGASVRTADAAFAALSGEFAEFGGMSYQTLGVHGAIAPGAESSAAAVS